MEVSVRIVGKHRLLLMEASGGIPGRAACVLKRMRLGGGHLGQRGLVEWVRGELLERFLVSTAKCCFCLL